MKKTIVVSLALFSALVSQVCAGAPKGGVSDEPLYLLYTPPGLSAKKTYPLVIALSPSADANAMINKWKQTAQKHKLLVLASKKFKNGTGAEDVLAGLAEIISEEFCARNRIDRNKIIATGISGGAMGSYIMALLYPDLVRAVVANTGMMYADDMNDSYPKNKLAVFLASPTDFRYTEMHRDRDFLEKRGWKTKWIEFTGGHTLAPDDSYEEAAQWLDENL
ncbi:MAG: hypothetical protein WCS77_03505 [Elusimicrobiaceae bacterium]